MHMTTAGENNKALKEVALELAHDGSKDPIGCQGEGPRAGRPGRQLEAEAEALKGAARLKDLNLWPIENGDANHS